MVSKGHLLQLEEVAVIGPCENYVPQYAAAFVGVEDDVRNTPIGFIIVYRSPGKPNSSTADAHKLSQ